MLATMRPEEFAVIELLAESWCLVEELEGIDKERFRAGIDALQDQVFALPTRRGYLLRSDGKKV